MPYFILRRQLLLIPVIPGLTAKLVLAVMMIAVVGSSLGVGDSRSAQQMAGLPKPNRGDCDVAFGHDHADDARLHDRGDGAGLCEDRALGLSPRRITTKYGARKATSPVIGLLCVLVPLVIDMLYGVINPKLRAS